MRSCLTFEKPFVRPNCWLVTPPTIPDPARSREGLPQPRIKSASDPADFLSAVPADLFCCWSDPLLTRIIFIQFRIADHKFLDRVAGFESCGQPAWLFPTP